MWAQFEELLKEYGNAGMTLAADKGDRIKIGQGYTLNLQLPKDVGGYLSVVAVDSGSEDATVLFPNDWATDETRYSPGATVKLPPSNTAKWGLQALLPASETLIVALVTPEPLGLYEKGIRQSRINPNQKVFAQLSPAGFWAAKAIRSTAAVANSTADAEVKPAAAAAKVIIDFHQ